jgi:CBS domain-containing protein
MKARDLMTSDPFAVVPTDTVGRAAQLMRDLRVGCIPIVKDQMRRTLIGLITDRDIAVRCVASGKGGDALVRDYMTAAPLQTVSPEADHSAVIEKMERAQVRRIPVVSEDGILLGIIAQADVAMKLGPRQPELVEEVMEAISRPAVLAA